jgi:periplasmic divalent cation tolerance protein
MAAAGNSSRIVFVMAGSEDEAVKIARALVEERLAACVNIVGPVRSIYQWRGAIEDEREYLLVIKSRARLYPGIERRVRELHGYEVPEVVSIPIVQGSKPYLDWLFESTSSAKPKAKAAKPPRPLATS